MTDMDIKIPGGKPLPPGFQKFGSHGLSVEEAREKMISAAEPVRTAKGTFVPKHVQTAARPVSAEAFVVEAPIAQTVQTAEPSAPSQSMEPVQDAQPTPRTPIPSRVPTERKRFRDDQKGFTVEIWQERGHWVAEISYDRDLDGTTPGAERFEASSQAELMMRLAAGKANATRFVRKANRQLKTAQVPDSWDYFYSLLKSSHNLTKAQFDALPKESRAAIQDAIQAIQIQEWLKTTPEYVESPENFQKICDYLNKEGIPISVKNLSMAWRSLREDRLIETAAVSTVSAAKVKPTVPSQPPVVASPVATIPTAAPSATAPPRKRGAYGGLIPGNGSAVLSNTAKEESDGGMTEAELRALVSTPEGMKQLRTHLVTNEWNKQGRKS